MAITVYGLTNCDTTRKLLNELQSQELDYSFVDLRMQPPGLSQIEAWLKTSPGQKLINRQSTTWRQLDESEKNDAKPEALLQRHPTLFKRPLVEKDGRLVRVGYTPALLKEIMGEG